MKNSISIVKISLGATLLATVFVVSGLGLPIQAYADHEYDYYDTSYYDEPSYDYYDTSYYDEPSYDFYDTSYYDEPTFADYDFYDTSYYDEPYYDYFDTSYYDEPYEDYFAYDYYDEPYYDYFVEDYFYPEYDYYEEYYEPFYGGGYAYSTPSYSSGGGRSSSNSNSGSRSSSSSNSSASATANASSVSNNTNTNINNNTNNNTTIVSVVNEQQPVVQQPFHQIPTCTLYGNPQNVNSGSNTTLIWNSSDATSASLSGFGYVPINGSRVASNITGTRVYTLTVNGQGGSNTCTTTITTTPVQSPTCTISSNPSFLPPGGSTTVSWNSTNADSAQLTNAGSVSTSGFRTFSNLQNSQTYTLTVTNSSGSNTCSTTANVQGTGAINPPSCTINVNPNSINNQYNYGNQSAQLSWSSSNATSAHINTIGTVSTNGTRSVSPNVSTTYSMTVTGQGGSNTCTTHLNVGTSQPPVYPPVIPPVIPPVGNLFCSITANPNSIQNGAGSVLSWTSTGANNAWISDGIGRVNVNGTLTVRPEASRNYTLTISNGFGQTRDCSTNVNVRGTYISLTQIPYTGFDFGPIGNMVYWFTLVGFAFGAAYVFVNYRGNVLDLAFSTVGSKRLSAVDKAEIVHEAVVVEDTQITEPNVKQTDNMTLSDGDENRMPRITINR